MFAQLPSRCPLCQMVARGGLLCPGCEADIFEARQQQALCITCGLVLSAKEQHRSCPSNTDLDALICAMDYQFPGQSLIQMYKEGKQLALARLLGDLMVRAAQPVIDKLLPDVWIPVPASLIRLQHTGFSPAQQLAKAVAARTGVPCRLDWLGQSYEGAPQKTLSRIERVRAVKGRFRADLAVRGLCVGLVDDVVTTSSTVTEAARALKAAGARQVIVLAAARTPQCA